jgi:hypothetical protein
MLCCVVAAYLVLRYILSLRKYAIYFGVVLKEEESFGWSEYCELDEYKT